MAAAGGGGAPPIDLSNPFQVLLAVAVIVVVCWALYRFLG